MRYLALVIVFLMSALSTSAMGTDVVIVRPKGSDFEALDTSISQAIKNDFKVTTQVLDRSDSYEKFISSIPKDVKVIIVMDNFTMKHLLKYFSENKESKIRGVATMGVNLKDVLPKNKNVAGVAYEIAGYLTIKGLKKSVDKNIRNITGFYRSSVSKVYTDEAQIQLGREKIKIDLVDIEGVSEDDLPDFVTRSLEKRNPDAVWLPNDNKLINSKMLSTVWMDVARRRKIPIACGIKKLSRELGICTYSESPTTSGISQKVVDIVYGYLVDENDAEFFGVEYIQETDRSLNKPLLDILGIKAKDKDVDMYEGKIAE